MANSPTKPVYAHHGIAAMQPNIDAHSTGDAKPNDGIALRENQCLGYVNLRLKNPYEEAVNRAIVDIFGMPLPAISEVARNEHVIILGLGPSEWLIITHEGAETALVQELDSHLEGFHHLAVDVSGGTTKLNITGERAQDLLEKGTYVDLYASVFRKDQLYATQIAHAPVVIVKNDDNDFSLIVRRSFANHLAEWAVDGAQEFGVSFCPA